MARSKSCYTCFNGLWGPLRILPMNLEYPNCRSWLVDFLVTEWRKYVTLFARLLHPEVILSPFFILPSLEGNLYVQPTLEECRVTSSETVTYTNYLEFFCLRDLSFFSPFIARPNHWCLRTHSFSLQDTWSRQTGFRYVLICLVWALACPCDCSVAYGISFMPLMLYFCRREVGIIISTEYSIINLRKKWEKDL